MSESTAITKELQASIELDQEKVSFCMPDGSVHKVELQAVLDSGDVEAALSYAQLLVLRNISEQQSRLADAMTVMANTLRTTSQQGPPVVDYDSIIDKVFGKVTDMARSSGMSMPGG